MITQIYDRFVGSIGYSATTGDNRDALVYEIFNYLCFNPTSILFDSDKRELKQLTTDALKRVFWLLDEDRDQKLNEEEFSVYKVSENLHDLYWLLTRY
jgi:hypothetical protein